jgi:hypothetical protein
MTADGQVLLQLRSRLSFLCFTGNVLATKRRIAYGICIIQIMQIIDTMACILICMRKIYQCGVGMINKIDLTLDITVFIN